MTREAIFDQALDLVWDRVIRDLGVDPATLVHTSGIH
jgi:putative AlgH/UPF0301 family transcriptional regulator